MKQVKKTFSNEKVVGTYNAGVQSTETRVTEI